MTEVKAETRAEEAPEKKKEKPKSLRTTAPSHAKFRSTGKPVSWLCRTIHVQSVPRANSLIVISNSEKERKLKEKLGRLFKAGTWRGWQQGGTVRIRVNVLLLRTRAGHPIFGACEEELEHRGCVRQVQPEAHPPQAAEVWALGQVSEKPGAFGEEWEWEIFDCPSSAVPQLLQEMLPHLQRRSTSPSTQPPIPPKKSK